MTPHEFKKHRRSNAVTNLSVACHPLLNTLLVSRHCLSKRECVHILLTQIQSISDVVEDMLAAGAAPDTTPDDGRMEVDAGFSAIREKHRKTDKSITVEAWF